MRRVSLFFGLLILSISLGSWAADAPALKALFDQGRWDEALKVLEAEGPQKDPSLIALQAYHLGTVHLRLNHLGLAVAYLEKAHYWAPGNADVQQNLAIARSGLAKSIGEGRLDPASTVFEQAAESIRSPEALAALALLSLALLALGWRLRSRLSIVGGCLLLAAMGGLHVVDHYSPAAVLIEHTVARSGPGDRFIEVNQTDVGSKVRLLGGSEVDAQGKHWLQIRFGVGSQVGWVPDSSLVRF